MNRFRIETEPNAVGLAEPLQFVQEGLSHYSFTVIPDDHGGCSRDVGFQARQKLSSQRSIQSVTGFAINAHDLLFMGDDPGFDAGETTVGPEQSATADFLLSQQS